MVADEQLLNEVRAVLHDEVADVTAPAALLSTVRARVRRRRTRRWLVAVPVAAAVVAVLAVVVLTPPEETPPTAQHSPTPTAQHPPTTTVEHHPVNLAHAAERTASALDAVLDNVIYESATVTKGDKYSEPGQAALYERWLAADGTTFRLRVTIDGDPVVDLSRDTVADVFVDYSTGTYRAFPGVEPNAPEYDDVWTPAEIQESLKNGTLTVVGPGDPVNGKPTILLHRDTRKAEVPLNLWVDAETYLPVRWEWEQANSTPFDVTYLPPTPENVANLTAVIPPGFTEAK
ncbi:hypothetical protein [Actinophytocola algeriensis]|uniref:Uncharacterized protein n=1 Tax=Actinophytocola algeriensis TaxID=1768010 RepID=A0A7W7Q5Z7_9PSEU|nr:hypothetical protein [Actinophytocola algeriensis]MBB4907537.1 hypothetical protein [Actinophytocola algeriensis]MBE1479567.1 hypothetical protein [Actinophytocola algeriensis]